MGRMIVGHPVYVNSRIDRPIGPSADDDQRLSRTGLRRLFPPPSLFTPADNDAYVPAEAYIEAIYCWVSVFSPTNFREPDGWGEPEIIPLPITGQVLG